MLEKRSKIFEDSFADYLNELHYVSPLLFEAAIEHFNKNLEKIKKGKIKRKAW